MANNAHSFSRLIEIRPHLFINSPDCTLQTHDPRSFHRPALRPVPVGQAALRVGAQWRGHAAGKQMARSARVAPRLRQSSSSSIASPRGHLLVASFARLQGGSETAPRRLRDGCRARRELCAQVRLRSVERLAARREGGGEGGLGGVCRAYGERPRGSGKGLGREWGLGGGCSAERRRERLGRQPHPLPLRREALALRRCEGSACNVDHAPREGLPRTASDLASAEPQCRNAAGLSGRGSMQTIRLPSLSAYGAVSVAQWPRRQCMS